MRASKVRSRLKQDGFASLLIAIVLILILSLITVGFAELTQREQRSALDKQLSSQAYYAAETGINDAAKALNAGYIGTKSTCAPLVPSSPSDPATFLDNNQVPDSSGGNATGASYPCLTINPNPPTLDYQSIDFSPSKVVELTGVETSDTDTPVPISYLLIGWDDPNGAHSYSPSSTALYPAASWPYTGVLSLSLTPLSSGHIDRTDLVSDNYSAFLYPNGSSAATASYPASDLGSATGDLLDGNCKSSNQPRDCNVKITQLGQANYVLSMHSIYAKVTVTIEAFDYSGVQLDIKNAQTVVDSTGKAQDVLRRIEVRIPTHNNYNYPDFDLQSTSSLCKQLDLTPTGNDGPASCTP